MAQKFATWRPDNKENELLQEQHKRDQAAPPPLGAGLEQTPTPEENVYEFDNLTPEKLEQLTGTPGPTFYPKQSQILEPPSTDPNADQFAAKLGGELSRGLETLDYGLLKAAQAVHGEEGGLTVKTSLDLIDFGTAGLDVARQAPMVLEKFAGGVRAVRQKVQASTLARSMRPLEAPARATLYTPEGSDILFGYFKESGNIPVNFQASNFDELTQEVTQVYKNYVPKDPKLSPAENLTASLKEAGYTGPRFKLNSKGNPVLAKSEFSRITLNKPQEEFIRLNLEPIYGPDFGKNYRQSINQEKIVMSKFNRYLKDKYGISWDIGHIEPAAGPKGGAWGLGATTSEPLMINRLMGDIQRKLAMYADDLGMTTNTVDDIYRYALQRDKLGVIDAEYVTIADLLAIDSGRTTPDRVLAKRRAQLREGEDIPTRLQQVTGEREVEGLLRAYFGNDTFDMVKQRAREIKKAQSK